MQPSAELNDLTRDYFHTRLFGLPPRWPAMH